MRVLGNLIPFTTEKTEIEVIANLSISAFI